MEYSHFLLDFCPRIKEHFYLISHYIFQKMCMNIYFADEHSEGLHRYRPLAARTTLKTLLLS